MKRILTIVALAVMLTATQSGVVSAQGIEPSTQLQDSGLSKIINISNFYQLNGLTLKEDKPTPKQEIKPAEPPKPEPVKYTVVEGDNLTKIAEAHSTTWIRLWQKNTEIANPDVIDIGDVLVIPTADEVLADRPTPTPPEVQKPVRTAVRGSYSGSTAGNGYDYGYCTWYVKNRRPDLPNNLGNANQWFYMAQADGLATGTTPRAGAVGQTSAGSLGHVVYVESVNADGTINISEMNYQGWGIVSSRTASASSFVYIY